MGKSSPKYKYLLGMDVESTGINFDSQDPSHGQQAISWGIVIINAHTLEPIEDLYLEVKWNEESKARRKDNPDWGKGAEAVHGLTYEYLEENGITEEEAAVQIANLIVKYWGPQNSIGTLGHNTLKFDVSFLVALMEKFNIRLRISARHVDTNSVGFAVFGTTTSDELFDLIGFDHRETHNALDDVYMSLKVVQVVRKLFAKLL